MSATDSSAGIALPETAHLSEITELTLVQLRGLPDWEAADVLDHRLRVLEVQYKRGFIERGIVLLEMQQRELWKHVRDQDGNPYTSFERWVVGSAPYSRRDCFAALAAVKQLQDVPREQLAEVPRCNIEVLKQLSPAVRAEPEVMERARSLSEREFRASIGVTHPEQCIEPKSLMEQAIEMAMGLEGCGRRAAEDVVAECYIAEHAVDYEHLKGPETPTPARS